MNKQHIRKGRLGKIARQHRASEQQPPSQVWDPARKVWVKL